MAEPTSLSAEPVADLVPSKASGMEAVLAILFPLIVLIFVIGIAIKGQRTRARSIGGYVLLGLLLNVLVAAARHASVSGTVPRSSRTDQYHEVANILNTSPLPMPAGLKYDKAAVAPGPILVLAVHYVNYKASELDRHKVAASLQTDTASSFCSAALKEILGADGQMEVVMNSADGVEVGEATVHLADCPH